MELLSEIWDKTTDAINAVTEGVSDGLMRLFGNSNERQIRRMRPIVARINEMEPAHPGPLRRRAAGQDGRVPPAARRGADPRRRPARGVRRLPRGGPPVPQDAALRRPAHGRHGPPRRQHRRDGHRRGQDPRRHPGRLSQRARGQGRPRRHRQRLPRPPRRRVDEPALQRPGPDRRRDPVGHGLGRAAGHLRPRHHLRHQQRVRLRLPPRQHEAVARAAGPGAAQLRDHRRGRLDPDRRGPDPADHLRPGLRRRPQVRRGRPDRPAPQERTSTSRSRRRSGPPTSTTTASARPSGSPGSRASTPPATWSGRTSSTTRSRPTTSTGRTATTSS